MSLLELILGALKKWWIWKYSVSPLLSILNIRRLLEKEKTLFLRAMPIQGSFPCPAGSERSARPRRTAVNEARLKPPFAGNVGYPLPGQGGSSLALRCAQYIQDAMIDPPILYYIYIFQWPPYALRGLIKASTLFLLGGRR
ncbi:hypothetical protein CFK37_07265 [Virgibacillus phasianinus]|uniref:Uncharacterized protein n=1 Tax=Virgibacillus phasianinus TaxID=2017483 RepID=A0A220U1T1_9BACI|nr:hypothetical protein CFK37_07265 [Virgibacillus phasianinus]